MEKKIFQLNEDDNFSDSRIDKFLQLKFSPRTISFVATTATKPNFILFFSSLTGFFLLEFLAKKICSDP